MSRSNLNGNDIIGPVVVNSRVQDIQLSQFTQALQIAVDKGDLELTPGRLPLGKIAVRTHSGNVQLSLPPNAKFELDAISNKGEVENDFADSLSTESNTRGGSIRGKVGVGPLLSLTTERGTMTIRKDGGEAVPEKLTATPVLPKAPAPPAHPRPAPVQEQ